LKSSLLDTAARCVNYELDEKPQPTFLNTYTYWKVLNDFMIAYKFDPDAVVKDLVGYYGKDALKLMDHLVKYNNIPAIQR
jgi:hypothetical protein